MKGSSGRVNIEAENQRGLMQRSFEYIFESLDADRINAENDSYHFEYLIRCSYLEIYNEQIMDLLEPTSINLHIREDIKKGVYVEGLQEEVVLSADDMIKLI
jgi:kinesin family protein 15